MCSQTLTKSEFDQINYFVYELIHKTRSSEDFKVLSKNLNFKDSISFEKFNNSLKSKYIFFENGQKVKNNFILPFYSKNVKENKLNLTIYSFSQIENSSFNDASGLTQAKYFLIFETTVYMNELKQIFFENTNLLYENKDVKSWYLKRFDDYLTLTNPIHSKYQYVPPPPPSIPHFIEHSPMHYDDLLFTHIEKKEWREAEVFVNKLIDYYPQKGRYYHLRAFVSYHLNKDYCNDLKKAVKNGILKEEPKLKNEISKMLNKCGK